LQQEGYAAGSITVRSFADLRYRGQSSEITVPVDIPVIGAAELRRLEAVFEEEFERTYGHRGPNKEFELVTCRMIATVIRDTPHASGWAAEPEAGAGLSGREAYFGPRFGMIRTPVLRRAALAREQRPGPLVIQEYDTSVVVPPDCTVAVDACGNILMEIASL
jgi:N-methylhydantoinase A